MRLETYPRFHGVEPCALLSKKMPVRCERSRSPRIRLCSAQVKGIAYLVITSHHWHKPGTPVIERVRGCRGAKGTGVETYLLNQRAGNAEAEVSHHRYAAAVAPK